MKFEDKVKVISGFYKGLNGVVLEERVNMGLAGEWFVNYLVKLTAINSIGEEYYFEKWIFEDLLKIVNEEIK